METYINSENVPASPTELLTMFASTSVQVDVFSDGVIQSVQAGEINALSVLIQLRAMERASARILKEIAPNLLNEADKYPEKEFEYQGNKITKAEHGVKYDFSSCGDVDWELHDQAVLSATKGRKDREEFLKSLKGPITLLDERTGEVVTITPPTKKSISGLNVTIK